MYATAVLEAAAANVAPAFLSTRPAGQYVRDTRLVPVRVDHVAFRRRLGAIWKQGKEPASLAARELLRAAMQTRPGPETR